MAGNYSFRGEDFDDVFLKDYAVLDKNVGAGSLFVWGNNNFGMLGTNDTTKYSSPVQTVSGGTTWKQISMASFTMSGIKSDNTLWIWGQGNSGQLGDGTSVGKSSPVQLAGDWKKVECGGEITGGIKTDGTLWMWGSNFYYGGLGNGTNTFSNVPVQTVSAGNNWKELSVGGNSVGAIKTDGTLWVWGRNNFGQLGLNDTTPRSSPNQTVAGGTNWKQVSVSPFIAGAIKTDGTLWMLGGWGDYGGMGDGSSVSKSSPVQVGSDTTWKQVATQQIGCSAIKTDGTLWLWGIGDYGNLGTNANVSKSSPVQTIAGGTNWKQVYKIPSNWACATKTDGTLWLWGTQNGSGVMGKLNDVSYSSPVQMATGGTNWKLASGGGDNAGAIYFFDSIDSYPSS